VLQRLKISGGQEAGEDRAVRQTKAQGNLTHGGIFYGRAGSHQARRVKALR
jgi:hypothetical protein